MIYSLHTTREEFEKWLMSAKKGESTIYHIGNLPADISQHADKIRDAMIELKGTVMSYAMLGSVSLVQRRVKPGCVEYIAQRVIK